MTDTAISPAEPDGAPRIAVLDMLRGLAILGILFMNINDMGTSFRAGDIRHFGWAPIDQIAWVIREIVANGTARCLLEMLFGAGMVILTERVAQGSTKWGVARRYYWRNFVLFLFGLAHMFIFLWPGDILHTYGMAALIVFWLRNLRPRWLISIGLIMALLQLGGGGYFGYYQSTQRIAQVAALQAKVASGGKLGKADSEIVAKFEKRKAERAKNRAQDAAEVAKEDKDRSGTTATWVVEQMRMNIERLFGFGELFAIWESASVMLIGAALFKMGVLQGERSRRFYVWLMLAGYVIGGAMRGVGAAEQMRFDDAPHTIWATQEVARQLMTLGHVGMINLLAMSVWGQRLVRPLVAAGRTALTIYVLQTIICLWILYPPFALGLYGQMTWASLMLTALVIDLGLLWLANWYVGHYRIAPVEWAWRSIVEGRRLPFRLRPVAPDRVALA